jgi:hypothetical protein
MGSGAMPQPGNESDRKLPLAPWWCSWDERRGRTVVIIVTQFVAPFMSGLCLSDFMPLRMANFDSEWLEQVKQECRLFFEDSS